MPERAAALQLVLIALAALLVASGLRVVRESERLIVFRLGRLFRLAGPGLVWLLPWVDRAVRVDLDAAVPNWRRLEPEALLEAAARYVRRPAPPR